MTLNSGMMIKMLINKSFPFVENIKIVHEEELYVKTYQKKPMTSLLLIFNRTNAFSFERCAAQ